MAFRGRPVFLVVSGLHFYIFSSCQSLMTVKKCQAELPLVIMSARYTALNLAHNRVTRGNFTLTFSRNRA